MAIIRLRDENGVVQELYSLRGEKGEKGADGTVTFDELTDEQKASLKGEPGYTPVVGVDYFTSDDKAEIVRMVLAELPNGDEVSY